MSYAESLTNYISDTYGAVTERPWARYPEYTTFKDPLSGKWFALLMNLERRTLGLNGEGEIHVLNVKADPEFVAFITNSPGYLPAYHMNKQHWITILLDGSAPLSQVYDRVEDSFRLITDTPTRRIYEAVRKIPAGRVATYGRVAELAGDKKMARAVGNALHKNPDPDTIPCFRVVNAKGELAGEFAFGGEGAQAKLLIADGVEVVDGRVDLAKYGF